MYQDILSKQNVQDPAAGDLLELEAQERANAAARRQSILTDAELMSTPINGGVCSLKKSNFKLKFPFCAG
jgi:hypothetical protein